METLQPMLNSLGVLTALIIGIATLVAQGRNLRRTQKAEAEKAQALIKAEAEKQALIIEAERERERMRAEAQIVVERLKNESAERLKAEEGRTMFVKDLMARLSSVEQTVSFLQGEIQAGRDQVQAARKELLDERQLKHDALGKLQYLTSTHEHEMHELVEAHDRAIADLKLSYELRLQANCNEIEKLRHDLGLPKQPCEPNNPLAVEPPR